MLRLVSGIALTKYRFEFVNLNCIFAITKFYNDISFYWNLYLFIYYHLFSSIHIKTSVHFNNIFGLWLL